MSTGFPFFMSAVADEAQALRRKWGWFLVLGILLILGGSAAIAAPLYGDIQGNDSRRLPAPVRGRS